MAIVHHIQSPQSFAPLVEGRFSVFFAGSIEMGKAEKWQDAFAEDLSETLTSHNDDHELVILNPRRADWDASWEQTMDNPQFREQVEWELEALEQADMIVMYLQPGTQSPVSLLELGLHASRLPEKLVVCCPDGFWRKGNVDIVCAKYGVMQVADQQGMLSEIKTRFMAQR